MLSEKYIAGLLDSDGSIGINYTKLRNGEPLFYARATLRFTECTTKSCMIPLIQENIGGNIQLFDRVSNYGPNPMRYLTFTGIGAVSTLTKLRKFVTVKRGVLDVACDVNGTKVTKEEVVARMKKARESEQYYPNFPSRRWMAGYADGNGCLSGAVRPNGKYQPKFLIAAWDKDVGVLELFKKQFGGGISRQGERTLNWYVSIEDPSKCVEVLEYLDSCIILKPKRDYLLSLARYGNFHDGKTIRAKLKTLTKPLAETKSPDVGNPNEAIVHEV